MSEFPISIMGGGGAQVDASYVVVALTAGLNNERRINAGTGIAIMDNGANSTIDIALSGGGGAGVAFVQGGNSFGAVGTLGTNDNNNLVLERNNTSLVTLASTALQPFSNDLISLGVSGTAFSDLFLASGGVVNFGAGEVTLTSAADLLSLAGGDFQLGGNVLIGNTTASGTLTLRATSSATDGAIIFQSDPTTQRATILSTGEFLVGAAALSNAEHVAEFTKAQNGATGLKVINDTSGTSAQAYSQVSFGAQTMTMATTSTAWTPVIGIAANVGYLRSSTTLQIHTGANAIIFAPADTEEMRLLSGGGLLVNATAKLGTEEFLVRVDQNAATVTRFHNDTSGTAAQVATFWTNATDQGAIAMYSPGFTPAGSISASQFVLTTNSGCAGGLGLRTHTTVPIIFSTNNTERARILSTGELVWGRTTLTNASSVAQFEKNQNDATYFALSNTTSGTAALAGYLIDTSTGGTAVQARLFAISTGYTSAGTYVAGEIQLRAEGVANVGLAVITTIATPIRFVTNAVEVARFTATGIAQFAPPAQSSGTTALLNVTSAVNTAGAVPYFSVTGAASTGQTASTEIAFANFNFNQTVTWATGALTTERCFLIQAPTLDFAAASTVTTATTVAITRSPASAGANSIITNAFALQVGGAATLGATAAGTIYGAVDIPAHTITYTGSTQITSAGPAGLRIGTLTITDASAVTIDTAAALYIAAAPVAAGSVTITNSYALWVDSGASRFDGRVLETQGADVASANDLTLGAGGNSFNITGSTQINAITTAGWQNGAMITLIFATAVTLKHNTAGGAGTAVMYLSGSVDFSATARDTITFKLLVDSGTTAWFEVARTVI